MYFKITVLSTTAHGQPCQLTGDIAGANVVYIQFLNPVTKVLKFRGEIAMWTKHTVGLHNYATLELIWMSQSSVAFSVIP